MKEFLTRMKWALSGINATVDLVDYDNAGDRGRKPLMVIEVVSENFKNVPCFSRTMIVDDMLKKRDPKLYQVLELAYECYTSDEYALGLKRKIELH
jgi:stress-induced morphogen